MELVRDQQEALLKNMVVLPDKLQPEAQRFYAEQSKRHGKVVVPFDGSSPLSQYRRDLLAQKSKQKAQRRRNSKAARKAKRR